MRVLFIGMAGPTSSTLLEALLAADSEICGVALPAGRYARASQPEPIAALPPPAIMLHNPAAGRTIAEIGWARGIPVFELRRASAPATLAALAALRPDVACVACFPLRLPPELLALPPGGVLNMHPSLLPAHRGPAPLFWTFRAGEPQAGVTIHAMDQQLDTGPIAFQARLPLPDGMGGAAAERECARVGGGLMLAALRALADGTLVLRPQPPGGSYEPWPHAEAWSIGADWPARRVFNFMRGTAEWGQPYRVRAGGRELALGRAIEYDEHATLGAPFLLEGEVVRVQLAPGVLTAQRAGEME